MRRNLLLPLGMALVLALLSGPFLENEAVQAELREVAAPPGGMVDLVAVVRSRQAAARRRSLAPVSATAPKVQVSSYSQIRGRLLDERGSPLVDAEILALGTPSPLREHTAILEPSNVEFATRTDADGLFSLVFNSPSVFDWRLEARSTGRASRNWSFSQIHSGTSIDLGQQAMPRAGSAFGKVTDLSGAPALIGWTLHAWTELDNPQSFSRPVMHSVRADETDEPGTVRFPSLAPGRVHMMAELDTGQWIPLSSLDISADQEARFEVALPVAGREESIVIMAELDPPAPGVLISRADVQLIDAAGRVRHPLKSGQIFVFPGLAKGLYEVTINDPRFEPIELTNLQPGDAQRSVRLRGSAALRLDVRDARTGEAVPRWSLRIQYGARRPSNEPQALRMLQAQWMTPRRDGLFEGILPVPMWCILSSEGHADKRVQLDDLRPMETRTINVSLESSSRIEGRVRTRSGKRCPQVQVTLLTPLGKLRETACDSSGEFEFDNLPPGEYSLHANAGGGRTGLLEDVRLVAGQPGQRLLLEVPEGHELQGVIRTRGLARIEECELLLTGKGMKQPERAQLDSDGRFRTGPLAVGEVSVSLALPGGQIPLDLGRHPVPGDSSPLVIDLLDRLPAELVVHLDLPPEDREGASVVLRAEPETESKHAVAAIDPTGLANFGRLPAGRYRLTVTGRVPGAQGRWVHPVREELFVLAGESSILEVSVPLIEREFVVLDELEKEPLRDTWLTLRSSPEARTSSPGSELSSNLHARTDARGRLRLRLPAGEYRLHWRQESPALPGARPAGARIEWRRDGVTGETVVLPLQ